MLHNFRNFYTEGHSEILRRMELFPVSFTDELPNSIPKNLHNLLSYRVRHTYQRVGVLLVYSRLRANRVPFPHSKVYLQISAFQEWSRGDSNP